MNEQKGLDMVGDKAAQVSSNMNNAKENLKEKQNFYREKDKELRDQHEQVTILEERS